MKSRFYRVLISAALLLLLITGAVAGPRAPAVSAADGDLVAQVNLARNCSFSLGYGVAFDGEYLWYTCRLSSPDLFKARPLTGEVVAAYNIAGGLSTLAWDGKRKKLWAGWGARQDTRGNLYMIDPDTGASTLAFNHPMSQCGLSSVAFGLADDPQDDSLYVSPDCMGGTTYHYAAGTGALLASFTLVPPRCFTRGMAIRGDHIYVIDNCALDRVRVLRKADHVLVSEFKVKLPQLATSDLACDSVTFAPRTVLWTPVAWDPRRAETFEVASGGCETGGGADSDGDGLLDEWEKDGVSIDPDGPGPLAPQFIDLKAMGADPRKPDIFLHIDWMADATHSHKLSKAAIRKVVDAFSASPYVSPTGSTWGALSRARALTHVNVLGTVDAAGNYDWTAFQATKDQAGGFTETGRTPIFHYVISAHQYEPAGSGGLSRDIPASDLIVSLGAFTGGDDLNYKPNYLSIMNYSYTLAGLIKGGRQGTLDYARAGIDIDESSLHEPAGLGTAAAGYGTIYYCGGRGWAVLRADGPIDWNCDGDGTDSGISADPNADMRVTRLQGYDDWKNITFRGGAIGLAGAPPVLPGWQTPARRPILPSHGRHP